MTSLRTGPPARAFENPGDDASVDEARQRFFHAFHHVEPRVTGDLMSEPLTLYRPIYQAWRTRTDRYTGWSFGMLWGSLPGWEHFKHATSRDPTEHRRLRDLLLTWSKKWRLTDEWCLQAAVETLADLSGDGDDPAPRPLYSLGTGMVELPFPEDALRFTFSSRGWEPTLESWSSAKDWIEDAFRRELQAYKEHVEAMARDAGLSQPSQPRDRGDDHMKWLARVVIDEDSYSLIARESGKTRQAVSKAVRKQAAAMGGIAAVST